MSEGKKAADPKSPHEIRREALHACDLDADVLRGRAPVGIAFSGGGIRSATISLGIAQALARHRRLFAIDYMSTVSGGGYLGSFLRGLFVPDSARGLTGKQVAMPDCAGEIGERRLFAERILRSEPHERIVDDIVPGGRIINPIWWLREHSRYLAPNGPTDFIFAVSHIARNWIAMLYVFVIAITFFFVVKTALVALIWLLLAHGFGLKVRAEWFQFEGWTLSPIMPVVIVLGFLSIASGAAMWMTEGMRLNAPWRLRRDITPKLLMQPVRMFFRTWATTATAAFTAGLMLFVIVRYGADWIGALPPLAVLLTGGALPPLAVLLTGGGLAIMAAMLVFAIVAFQRTDRGGLIGRFARDRIKDVLPRWLGGEGRKTVDASEVANHPALDENPTAELRRRLTNWLSKINIWFAIALVLTVIDTLAIAAHDEDLVLITPDGIGNLWSVVVLPLSAFLIKKIPDWFGGKGGRFALTARSIAALSLALGAGLFALTAVFADSIVHRAAWRGDVLFGEFDLLTFAIYGILIAILFCITGASDGFINLSSLHGFYASRLTRAYLGATNLKRLRLATTNVRAPAAPAAEAAAAAQAAATPTDEKGLDPPIALAGRGKVTLGSAEDYIDVGLYQTSALPAPIHLINVTLNETIGASNLVDRARKGALMTFAPEGVLITAREAPLEGALAPWDTTIATAGCEPLTVGQLCAISGAAASSGMGRMTTLGGALAFTFANVRLGYWWTQGPELAKVIAHRDGAAPSAADSTRKSLADGIMRWSVWQTYRYLLHEMTARYSREYERLYLSDGGHFENSGALELIRRGAELIIVADNGCDPKYTFSDLEVLIRTARLDIGRNVEVATPAEVVDYMGAEGAKLFFNGQSADWRTAAAQPGGSAFALLLNVTVSKDVDQRQTARIIWLKPRKLEGMAGDVAGYAASHESFPHESTGDQFFDEAQWESYRRLGVEMAHRLISAWDGVDQALPALGAPHARAA